MSRAARIARRPDVADWVCGDHCACLAAELGDYCSDGLQAMSCVSKWPKPRNRHIVRLNDGQGDGILALSESGRKRPYGAGKK